MESKSATKYTYSNTFHSSILPWNQISVDLRWTMKRDQVNFVKIIIIQMMPSKMAGNVYADSDTLKQTMECRIHSNIWMSEFEFLCGFMNVDDTVDMCSHQNSDGWLETNKKKKRKTEFRHFDIEFCVCQNAIHFGYSYFVVVCVYANGKW